MVTQEREKEASRALLARSPLSWNQGSYHSRENTLLSFQGEGQNTCVGGANAQSFPLPSLKTGVPEPPKTMPFPRPEGPGHSRTCNMMPQMPDVKDAGMFILMSEPDTDRDHM